MIELFGLIFSLLILIIALLPVLTFLRLSRLSRDLDLLADRVSALERAPRALTPSDEPAAATARARPADDAADERRPAAPADAGRPLAFPPATEPAAVAPPHAFEERPPSPPATERPDLESRIGGRGLLYTGVVVLLLGMSFFLKYAFDNRWIDETGRVALGALAGAALIVLGGRLAAKGLGVFGQALIGTGLAILYLAIFAAFNFYELIGQGAAFVAMIVVTIGAAALADRQQSQPLAMIAVGGGFLTPFLVASGEGSQLALFSYDALLVAGTLVLAVRHRWATLNALSYVFTVLTIVAWTSRSYDDDLWLRTLLFLTLFCVLFLLILRVMVRTPGLAARLVTLLLASGPVLYYIAAVVITAGHPPAAHVYLITFTAVGLWLTAEPHRPAVRLLVLLAGFAPLFGNVTLPQGLSWIAPNAVTIVAVAALHVLAILDRIYRQNELLERADLATLHLTGLGLFGLLYAALQPAYPDFRGGLAAILALGAIVLWQLLMRRDYMASLNAAALAFTLAAIGVAVQFDGPAVIVGWAAEGAAAAWIGSRAQSRAFVFGGMALWSFAALRVLESYSSTPSSFVVLLNARSLAAIFVIALGYVMAARLSPRHSAIGAHASSGLHVAASALTLVWITGEIQSFWDLRDDSPQAFLYEQMLLSLAWGLYGAALVIVGMRRAFALTRYIGITVIAGTVLKVFFFDLWQLGGIYRVIGFIGFGVLLVLVSYLYQKRREPLDTASAPPSPPPMAHSAGSPAEPEAPQ